MVNCQIMLKIFDALIRTDESQKRSACLFFNKLCKLMKKMLDFACDYLQMDFKNYLSS